MTRLRLLPVLLVFGPVVLWSAGKTSGIDLFHKMQAAIGGADRIAAVHDFEQFERADTWFPDGRARGTVRKRVRFIRPSNLRIDQVGPGDTYALYFDGKSGWQITPEGKLTDLSASDIRFAQGYLNGLRLNAWLLDRDPDVVFTSDGPNQFAISTRQDPTHKEVITLDPSTFLEVKATGISLADPDHPVSSETQIKQWRAFDGIKFPVDTINIHSGKKLAEIFTEDIRLNRRLKQVDLAAKPADLKPAMGR